MKRKAGRPKKIYSRLGLREVGAVRRGRKMPRQKGPKKVTKIYASSMKNLGTDLDLPSVYTMLKSQSMFKFIQMFI
jgi:hypothetical protein